MKGLFCLTDILKILIKALQDWAKDILKRKWISKKETSFKK